MGRLTHTFEPVFDRESCILILGTFPSVKSRENQFYYGNPQNRFWRVTAAVMDCPVPVTVEEKKEMLLSHHIAIWDVIASCEITGSSDSSIREAVPNDIGALLRKTAIEKIFCNGGKAGQLYAKYCAKACGREAVTLPSTSPANAAWTLARLIDAWRVLTD